VDRPDARADGDAAGGGRAGRAPLPEGTISVGIGLLVAGVTIYVFFKLGQEALGQDGFKPIVALWFVMFALAPGFYLPIEQEVSRAISHRRAVGQGARPVVRKVVALCAAIVVGLVASVLALAPAINDELFEGYGIVTASLAIALASYGLLYLAKGLCSGNGRFASYGFIVGADGAIRVAICGAMLALGVDRVGAYSMMVALVPVVGVAIVWTRGGLRTEDGPPATWGEIAPNLGWLLGGSIFAAALVNAGPITVDVLGDTAPAEEVTRFGNAVLLSRVPLFLFQAVQAALLPRLARLAARGDIAEFRAGFRRLMVLVVGVGVIGTAGAFAVGPWVLDLVYGGGVSRRTLTLLAFASAIYMLALAIAQALIALHGHRLVAVGWTLAFASFVGAAAWSSDDLYLRVEVALVASSAVALVAFAAALRAQLASGATWDEESVVQAIGDRPIET
jgi:O-antigen/teichoic acid export membrane protein